MSNTTITKREEKPTRDWVQAAKDQGKANTDRHREKFKQNWDSRFDGCPDCKREGNQVQVCNACGEKFKSSIPCEGCGVPVEAMPNGEPYPWAHVLCATCEVEKPEDFLEYEKARVLCDGEIRQKTAMLNMHKERAAYVGKQLLVAQKHNAGLMEKFHKLKAKLDAIEEATKVDWAQRFADLRVKVDATEAATGQEVTEQDLRALIAEVYEKGGKANMALVKGPAQEGQHDVVVRACQQSLECLRNDGHDGECDLPPRPKVDPTSTQKVVDKIVENLEVEGD